MEGVYQLVESCQGTRMELDSLGFDQILSDSWNDAIYFSNAVEV